MRLKLGGGRVRAADRRKLNAFDLAMKCLMSMTSVTRMDKIENDYMRI